MSSRDETYELVVKMSPEGAEETQDQLDETQAKFEESADTAGQEAGRLEDFSGKWKGAMGVVVTALGVATAGLLSQVPIVSDLMAGLGAIVEATALKIDEAYRPALSKAVTAMFDFAEMIGEVNGEVGRAIGVYAGWAAGIGALAGAIAVAAKVSATVAAAVAAAAGLISASIAIIIAAVLALIPILLFDLFGIRTKFVEFINAVISQLFRFPGALARAIASLISKFVGFLEWLWGWGERFGSALADIATDAAEEFLDPIYDALRTARRLFNDIKSLADSAAGRASGIGGGFGGFGGIPGLQSGGTIREGGLAMLHPGERVVPAADVESGNGGGSGRSNRFAEETRLRVQFEPREFERFVSAELKDDPANTGRSAGPR